MVKALGKEQLLLYLMVAEFPNFFIVSQLLLIYFPFIWKAEKQTKRDLHKCLPFHSPNACGRQGWGKEEARNQEQDPKSLSHHLLSSGCTLARSSIPSRGTDTQWVELTMELDAHLQTSCDSSNSGRGRPVAGRGREAVLFTGKHYCEVHWKSTLSETLLILPRINLAYSTLMCIKYLADRSAL